MGTFTLFVALPNEEVCSLRNLASGTTIRDVRKKLELSAGLPAQTYRLTCAQGRVMHEDHVMRLDVSVWDGFLLRATFLESWAELRDAVAGDEVAHVLQHGAVHVREDVVWIAGEDEGRAQEVTRERGVVALYLASYLGLRDMCKALLSVDVDPNGRTPFGRTALFVAMSRDHDHVMELLLAHNALLEASDVDGVTAEDEAKRAAAKLCLRKIRYWKLHHRHHHHNDDIGSGEDRRRTGAARPATAAAGAATSRSSCPRGGGGEGSGRHGRVGSSRIPSHAGGRDDHYSASSSACSGPVSKRQAGKGRLAHNNDHHRDNYYYYYPDHSESGGSVLSASSTGAGVSNGGSREDGGLSRSLAGAGTGAEAARLRARRRTVSTGTPTNNNAGGRRPISGGGAGAGAGAAGSSAVVSPPQSLFKQSQLLYSWDNNLAPAGRAPSAAGTVVRIPPPRPGEAGGGGRVGGGRSLSAKRAGSAHRKAGSGVVSWGENTSFSPGVSPTRMLPCRPTLFSLSVDNPGYALSASSPCLSAASSSTSTVRGLEAYGSSSFNPGRRRRRPESAAVFVKFPASYPHRSPASPPSSSSSPPHPDSAPFPQLQPSSSLSSLTGRNDPADDVVTAVEDREAQAEEPHGPAQEPPGRPPTRDGDPAHKPDVSDFARVEFGGGDGVVYYQQGSAAGHGSVTGSQEALSVGSAPELLLSPAAGRGAEGADGAGLRPERGEKGDSDDDGGRVSSRTPGKGSRRSVRFRTHQMVTRMKEERENRRTMQRRLKLAEDLKTTSAKTKAKEAAGNAPQPETFEQWLDRKRKERQRSRNSSSDEDTSGEEDEDDVRNRTAENSQAFNDWLKDLKERPLRRPHTSTPASLHRRKSRPLKGVIQIDAKLQGPVQTPDLDSYMTAYQQWSQGKNSPKSNNHTSGMDVKEAKNQLEEKRKSMLAMALTYEDWLEHTEERKKLMQIILQADMAQLSDLEQQVFRTQRAPRQISFDQWLDKIDKKETEMRQQRQRMRKEAELRQHDGYYMGDGFMRSSAAIAHEEWVRRKKEEAQRAKRKEQQPRSGDSGGVGGGVGGAGRGTAGMSEDEKRAAWEEWLDQKHKRQVAQLGQHIRKERQLLLTLRQKKNPTATPC